MATIPYFILGPNTFLSMLGLARGADKTVPTPAEDWRDATVDVIIPALNEEETIIPCLASVIRQTVRPRRILLIDDGSSDSWARHRASAAYLACTRRRGDCCRRWRPRERCCQRRDRVGMSVMVYRTGTPVFGMKT